MDADFPAAHSMDTMWFAVDGHGHVAVFDTGENGHAPEQVRQGDIDSWYDLCAYFERGSELDVYLSNEEGADRMGIFLYVYHESFDPIAPYTLAVKPEALIHLDQLPPRFRAECLRCRFPQLDFAQTERIQPLEHGPCNYWYTHNRVAYLMSDGRTVKPIPGQEEKFQEFCEAFRREQPYEAQGLHFEGTDTGQERA
jgi:hypothetical protein